MKKSKKIILIIIFVLVIIIFILLNYSNFKKNIKQENEIYSNAENDYLDMKNSSAMYNNDSTLGDLKNEYKITGKNEIYEVNIENDGRKVINVKADINYKVAFCGMIKNTKPNFEEVNSIFEINNPIENGIWIKQDDGEKILEYLNNNKYLNSEYSIDEDGYLKIVKKNNSTDIDKKIEKLINGNNQYLLNISSICYMVDTVTGEIVENPYNDLEEYQTYEYFKDQNRIIIFITENVNSKMANDDIFESLIKLLDCIQ